MNLLARLEFQWRNPKTLKFSPLPEGPDDFARLLSWKALNPFQPDPIIEILEKAYYATLKFVQFYTFQKIEIPAAFIDLVFYKAVQRTCPWAVMAAVTLDSDKDMEVCYLCMYIYGCLLSPASWIYRTTVDKQYFHCYPLRVISQSAYDSTCLSLENDLELGFLQAFKTYGLEPPLYTLRQ